jgi:SAM-dependent methyltransferase
LKTEGEKHAYNWESVEQVQAYLSKSENLPHREEIKQVLLEQIPTDVRRVLDLGTGDGRLLELVKSKNPYAEGIGLDFSKPMLKLAKKRFNQDRNIKIIEHDLKIPLPELGSFDLIISGLAIHHLAHKRKNQLYHEVFNLLESKGMFFNLDHVVSSTKELHYKFLSLIGLTPDTDDHGNLLLDVETQLGWLREIGFVNVDCYWKWLEIALLVGIKP